MEWTIVGGIQGQPFVARSSTHQDLVFNWLMEGRGFVESRFRDLLFRQEPQRLNPPITGQSQAVESVNLIFVRRFLIFLRKFVLPHLCQISR